MATESHACRSDGDPSGPSSLGWLVVLSSGLVAQAGQHLGGARTQDMSLEPKGAARQKPRPTKAQK